MLQNLRGEDFFAMMIQTESDNVYNFVLKSPYDSKKRERKKNWRKRRRKRERKIKTKIEIVLGDFTIWPLTRKCILL